jgi:hypothetical protein
VVADLPVGENLSDHPCVTSKWVIAARDASIGIGPMVTELCDWLAGPPTDWISFHRAKDVTLEKASEHLKSESRNYYLSGEKAHWEAFAMYAA